MEELTNLKRPWCWERLRAGGKGDPRGLDGWMASLIQWTWVCVTGSWWWIGRPGVLQSTGRKELDTSEQLNWCGVRCKVTGWHRHCLPATHTLAMGVGDRHAEQPLPNKKIAIMKQNIKCSGDINSTPLSQLSWVDFCPFTLQGGHMLVPTSPNFSIIDDFFPSASH